MGSALAYGTEIEAHRARFHHECRDRCRTCVTGPADAASSRRRRQFGPYGIGGSTIVQGAAMAPSRERNSSIITSHAEFASDGSRTRCTVDGGGVEEHRRMRVPPAVIRTETTRSDHDAPDHQGQGCGSNLGSRTGQPDVRPGNRAAGSCEVGYEAEPRGLTALESPSSTSHGRRRVSPGRRRIGRVVGALAKSRWPRARRNSLPHWGRRGGCGLIAQGCAGVGGKVSSVRTSSGQAYRRAIQAGQLSVVWKSGMAGAPRESRRRDYLGMPPHGGSQAPLP